MEWKSGRGGARPGAGRPKIDPKLKRVQIGSFLPGWMVAWLRRQDRTQGEIIEEALIEKYELKPPE